MSNKYLDIAMEKVIKQEVNKVLDEIRVEIRKKMRFDSFNESIVSFDDISKIFDKYKTERSDKE